MRFDDSKVLRALANDAVQLFLGAIGRRPVPPRSEAGRIAGVVRCLDGLPLALELAAARLEVMTIAQLHERLSDRFRVLVDPTRRARDRHARLSSAIDWSWRELRAEERSTLSQLSVFEGGLDLEAAEAVVRLPPTSRCTVLDAIHSLCRQSLVRVDHGRGAPRFSLYECVRAHAARRLGGAEDAVSRHAAYYVARGVQWAVAGVLERIAAQEDNLVAVVRRAAGPEAHSAALVLSEIDRLPAASLRILDEALASGRAPDDLLARVLLVRAQCLRELGRIGEAETDAARALSLAHRAGRGQLEARAQSRIGDLYRLRGRLVDARRHLEAALELGRADRSLRADALLGLGLVAIDAVEAPVAEAHLLEALANARQAGDRRVEQRVLATLGTMCLEAGRAGDARRWLEEALACTTTRGAGAAIRAILGAFHHHEGDLGAARELFDEALQGARSTGDRRGEGVCLLGLARLEIELGKIEAGLSSLEEALRLLGGRGDPRHEAIALYTRAAGSAIAGKLARAQEDLARADAFAGGVLASLGEVVRGLIEIASAIDADERLDRRRARELRARARARSTALSASGSYDVRVGHRTLCGALDAAAEQDRAWVFDAAGMWFLPGGGERVSLGGRKTLVRLLVALVTRRLDRPGEPCSMTELVEAGWPGTRLLPGSAQNRVHVALSTLRKAGLEGLLIRARAGYCLDPDVPLRTVDRSCEVTPEPGADLLAAS